VAGPAAARTLGSAQCLPRDLGARSICNAHALSFTAPLLTFAARLRGDRCVSVFTRARALCCSVRKAGWRKRRCDRRLIGVLTDQLASPEVLPLSLSIPKDKRARLVAERLQQNPSDETELAALGRFAGASPRTLQRLFRSETGLRFVEWRRRLRLLHAAILIGAGSSVTEAGLEAGYQSTSAFVAAFRTELGCTPARMRPDRNQNHKNS